MSFLLAGLVVPRSIAPTPAVMHLRQDFVLLAREDVTLVAGHPLPADLDRSARDLSATGRVVYVEAEFFGGTGAQASIGWEHGGVALGPIRTQTPGEDYAGFEEASRPEDWAVTRALVWLGVDVTGHRDAFEALGLGTRRSWLHD